MLGKLVLLRHGESTWNREGLFTGWVDVGLSDKGETEARRGGELLKQTGMLPDIVHTSLLRRAIRTVELALDGCDRHWIPVARTWRLNERHYGALQGKGKKETLAAYGEVQFKVWRRSYDVPPPPVAPHDPNHPRNDPRYAGLPPDVLPATECLKDVLARVLPYWHDAVVPGLRAGLTVLVGAHGNSLRALVKHLDGLGDAEVVELNLPTGIPLLYELDDALRPRVPGGRYLDPVAAAAAIEAVKNQGR